MTLTRRTLVKERKRKKKKIELNTNENTSILPMDECSGFETLRLFKSARNLPLALGKLLARPFRREPRVVHSRSEF
jgi:hypothetical protein